MPNTATQKQIQFIKTLAAERQPNEQVERVLQMGRTIWNRGQFDHGAASDTIDALKSLPKNRQPVQEVDVPEGMHKVGDKIYKVQVAVHGSGRKYAKRLVLEVPEDEDNAAFTASPEKGTWNARFEYAKGAMSLLSEDTLMTLEQAKEFGALYGTCCVCGRTLTNEKSIAAGIGPVCGSKF